MKRLDYKKSQEPTVEGLVAEMGGGTGGCRAGAGERRQQGAAPCAHVHHRVVAAGVQPVVQRCTADSRLDLETSSYKIEATIRSV